MLNLAIEVKRWGQEMLRAIDKGVAAAELSRPPAGVYGEIDLRVIPKYVSYRAALFREKVGMQFLLGLTAFLWLATFLIHSNRIDYWQTRFREKEFILVPSNIVGHTPAVPQDVPKSYVGNAATYFVELLGNPNRHRDAEACFKSARQGKPQVLRAKSQSQPARTTRTLKTR